MKRLIEDFRYMLEGLSVLSEETDPELWDNRRKKERIRRQQQRERRKKWQKRRRVRI